MRKLNPCILLFIFIYSVVSAQQHKIDSLYAVLKVEKDDTNKVLTLTALSQKFKRIDNFKAVDSLARAALALSEKLSYKRGLALATYELGSEYTSTGKYPEALKYYLQSLNLSTELNYDKGIEYASGGIGNVYYGQANYPEALKYYLKSLKMAEKRGDTDGMGNSYLNIGNIYNDLNQNDEALSYYELSLKLDIVTGNKFNESIDYCNIGAVCLNQHKYNEATQNQLKSLKLGKEINNLYCQTHALSNLGTINCKQGNYDTALEYVTQALNIEKQTGDKVGMCEEYVNLCDIYTRQRKYIEAYASIHNAINISKEMGEKEVTGEAYAFLTAVDSASGNFKAAYKDYVISIAYADSMKNEENTKKMVSEQMTYEFDKKQAEEKAIQDKKDAEEVVNKKRQQVIMASVSVGLLLVLVFSTLLLSRFRITQKQKRIIEEQKALVEEKNKEVLDSIIYAKRLQDAILPPLSIISKYLPESFVLYKPKDIVAGDFYWMERAGDTILIAACDCTGHGVPGAMVSVVCSNALNRAVKEFHIMETGKILDKVRELVLETFSHRDPLGEKSESEVKDGMDISLVAINRKSSAISWSGAYNSLWYIRNGELKEVAADKQPIGKNDKPTSFNTHNLNLQKGDTLYLFTDGYADQFGGDKGKKFKYKPFQEKLLAVSNKPMTEQKQELETTFENWKGNLEQVDDVLIIGIRV